MRATLSFILALPLVLALPTIDRRQEAGVQRIADSWIVELEDDADLAKVLKKVSDETGVEAKSEYKIGGFKGFSFDGDDATVDALAEMGALKRIEADVVVEVCSEDPNDGARTGLTSNRPMHQSMLALS